MKEGSPPKKEWKLRFWHILVSGLVLIILLYCLFIYNCRTRIKQKIKEIHDAGHPVTIEQYHKKYEPPVKTKNAADLYIQAFKNFAPPTAEENKLLPVLGEYHLPDDGSPIPQESLLAMQEYIEKNNESLKFIEKGNQVKDCYYPKDFQYGFPSLEHLTEIRRIAQAQSIQNLYLAETNQSEKFSHSFQSSTGFSSSVSQGAIIIDYFFQIAMEAMCVSDLEYAMNRLDFSREQYEQLDHVIQEMTNPDHIAKIHINDRIFATEMAQNSSLTFAKGMLFSAPLAYVYSYSGLINWTMLCYLEEYDEFIHALGLPYTQRLDAARDVQKKYTSIPVLNSMGAQQIHLKSLKSIFAYSGANYAQNLPSHSNDSNWIKAATL